MRYAILLLLILTTESLTCSNHPIITLTTRYSETIGDLVPSWEVYAILNIEVNKDISLYVDSGDDMLFGSEKILSVFNLKKGENKIVETWKNFEYTRTLKIYGDSTAIESLDCSNMNAVSIDVSRNKNLKRLFTSDNILLNNINTSSLSELEELHVSHCSIKKLNVSANKKLKILSFSINPIKTIDLNYNTELEAVDCSGTKLKKLDISKNLNLRYLKCTHSNITKLDLSNNKKLKAIECYVNKISDLLLPYSDSLEFLDCSINKLKLLDLSKSSNLKIVSSSQNEIKKIIFSDNNKLENLRCNKNKLDSLYLNLCPNLKILLCNSNSFKNLNVFFCKKLQVLDCSKNKLEDLDVSSLEDLEDLLCSRNNINGIKLGIGNLKRLNVSENKLTSLDLRGYPHLAEFQAANTLLRIIDVLLHESINKNNVYLYRKNNGIWGAFKHDNKYYFEYWKSLEYHPDIEFLFGKNDILLPKHLIK